MPPRIQRRKISIKLELDTDSSRSVGSLVDDAISQLSEAADLLVRPRDMHFAGFTAYRIAEVNSKQEQ